MLNSPYSFLSPNLFLPWRIPFPTSQPSKSSLNTTSMCSFPEPLGTITDHQSPPSPGSGLLRPLEAQGCQHRARILSHPPPPGPRTLWEPGCLTPLRSLGTVRQIKVEFGPQGHLHHLSWLLSSATLCSEAEKLN